MIKTGSPGPFGLRAGRPLVCAIVNVTPDSFSDGGKYLNTDKAIAHGLALHGAGADLLDIGGESTRPGAEAVSAEQELARILPVIEGIRANCDIPLSIDTSKPKIARAAIKAGAKIWNDVSALQADPKSASVAAALACPVILMHRQGTPKTMQQAPAYKDVVAEVIAWLQCRVEKAQQAGIKADKIMVDPGIGFGKSTAHNVTLLANLSRIAVETGCPLMLGASRKRFIRAIDPSAKEGNRLGGSLACIAEAFDQKVAMVRVHDARETVQMLKILQEVRQAREQ